MLIPDVARTSEDLQAILQLQHQNLKQHVSESERQSQGFVTLQHTLPILQAMHEMAPSVVIRQNNAIVGYALTELPECRKLMPALEPMFALLDNMDWNGKPIREQRFYTMGQICIEKDFRGQGLFEMLYQHHRKVYQDRFDLFITEISTQNTRSIRAHEKIGFQTILTHRDELDEWSMVLWDWTR